MQTTEFLSLNGLILWPLKYLVLSHSMLILEIQFASTLCSQTLHHLKSLRAEPVLALLVWSLTEVLLRFANHQLDTTLLLELQLILNLCAVLLSDSLLTICLCLCLLIDTTLLFIALLLDTIRLCTTLMFTEYLFNITIHLCITIILPFVILVKTLLKSAEVTWLSDYLWTQCKKTNSINLAFVSSDNLLLISNVLMIKPWLDK